MSYPKWAEQTKKEPAYMTFRKMKFKFQHFVVSFLILTSLEALAWERQISCRNNQNGDDEIHLKLSAPGNIVAAQWENIDRWGFDPSAWDPVTHFRNSHGQILFKIHPNLRSEYHFSAGATLLIEAFDNDGFPSTLRLFDEKYGPQKYAEIYSCWH